jgi:membrane-associated phospholipid phosphatase
MAQTTGMAVLACMLGSAAMLAQAPESPGPEPGGFSALPTVEPETVVSPGEFVKNVLHDQKRVFTFPGRAVRGKHWKPVLAITFTTVGLVVLDPHTEPYFRDANRFSSYRTGPLRGRNTALAESLTPVAFYVAGLVKHSPHARNTGLLAAEGLIDAQIASFMIKQAVGRLKPTDIPPGGSLRNTWFKYRGDFSNGGGFPSGHTASAFAVATVIAERYKHRRWVPWAAYGAATFLSLSRLTSQAHFPSDIFMGAALGYGISHFVVLRK